jgi:nicotinamidase-related amidase
LRAPAVLVVDMQNDILKGPLARASVRADLARALPNVRALIDVAHEMDVPVIFTRIAFRPDYVDANPESPARILKAGLLDGTSGAAVIDEVTPEDRDYTVLKRRASAFYGTDLDILLRGLGAHSLVIAGCATSRAVESTARDAHARDYHAIVLDDAAFGMTTELHNASLRAIADFYGEVASTETVTKALRARSTTEKSDERQHV